MIETFPERALETVGNVMPPIGAANVVFVATADKQIANTTTETTLFGSGSGSLTLPAGLFSPGSTLLVTMRGFIQGVSSPTVQIKSKLGGTTVCDTGTAGTTLLLSTVHAFHVDVLLTCRTSGSTGTVIGQSSFICADIPTFQNSETSAAATIDTTGTLALDVTFKWSAANASNIVTITNAVVQVLN